MAQVIDGYLLEKRWAGDKDVWQCLPNSFMDLGIEQNPCPCGVPINACRVVQRCNECLNEAYGFPRIPQAAGVRATKL